MMCRFFRRAAPGLTCYAYPDGIPEDIIYSRTDHRKPVAEDHGIHFEQDPAMPKLDPAWYDPIFAAP